MTVYFGNMNMPIFGQAHHTMSHLSTTSECCIFCYQHGNSSVCRTVRTWSERLLRVNSKHLCHLCLTSHFYQVNCPVYVPSCDYCGATRKHHKALCPENPILKENDDHTPTTEKESPEDDELQERINMLTDKGLCHRCLGRHRTELCLALHRCQTCQSPHHHQVICPKEPSMSSNNTTVAPSPTLEDRPASPVPLPLDLPLANSENDEELITTATSQFSSDVDAPPMSTSQATNIETQNRCLSPPSEASDNSFVVWMPSDCVVPSDCRWDEAYSPFFDDDYDIEMDQAPATVSESPVCSSTSPSDATVSCPTLHSSKPANDCSKKTHLEMLFSGCRIDEDVIRPEPHTDAPPAKSHGMVKCWIQNLRKSSPESTALPEAEKELSSDGYTKEYYNKMYSEVLRYHEHLKAEMGPEKYWYYYCYSYYYYYYPELLNQWLNAITPVAGADATQTDASPQPTPQVRNNESRNRCSSASSGASDDSFVMWKSPDSPVPSECRWDEACAPSFGDDFDNDMDASTQPTPQPTASSGTTDSSLSSDPTKPSNTKKTTLEMLFSACSMNEDVVRLESHADAPPAKSYDNVNCWLQNLRRGSAESASSPEVVALTQLTPQSTTPYVSNYPQWCINAVLRHYNSIEDYISNS